MSIATLKLTNVGPFDDIEFEFDRQVNVFTGPNNSGKSTTLWGLWDILVFPSGFPPKMLREGKTAEFEVQLWGDPAKQFSGQLPIALSEEGYWSKERWADHGSILELVGYTNFIPALRRSTDFRSPGPTVDRNRENEGVPQNEIQVNLDLVGHQIAAVELQPTHVGESYDDLFGDELRKRRTLVRSGAFIVSDQRVMQKIIDLDYRSYRRKEPASRDIIVKIGEMASEITEGFPIQFLGVDEDARGLFPQFHTPDGNMPLNALSQGTQSLIQWLAHFLIGYAEYYEFPESLADKPGVFIVDEIDAHLHPSWQRRIIPTLTRHFPGLQIFCSTHSPLMLAGLKEGQAQLLRRDDQGKVVVSRNESDIIGWSVDEITRILLDVPNPTDLETVKHLERLQELRHKQTLSTEEAAELEQLRHTVNQDLLGGPMAAQIDRFVEILEQAKAEQQAQREPVPATPARTPRRRRKVSE